MRRENSSISLRVTDGANSDPPVAMTRIAETSCSSGASLRRKPLAPALSAPVDVLVEVERRQHEDARARLGEHHLARRLDPVEHRHADVHQDDIWRELAGACHGLRAVAGLADHLDSRLRLENHPEAGTDERLIVGEQDADHRSLANGSRARTA